MAKQTVVYERSSGCVVFCAVRGVYCVRRASGETIGYYRSIKSAFYALDEAEGRK